MREAHTKSTASNGVILVCHEVTHTVTASKNKTSVSPIAKSLTINFNDCQPIVKHSVRTGTGPDLVQPLNAEASRL